MKITRRNFVQTLGTAAALTVAGGSVQSVLGNVAAEHGKLGSTAKTLFSMKSAQVNSFVGRTFIVSGTDGKTVGLVLSEVNGVRRSANSKQGYSGECFSVMFKGGAKESLDQGVYSMRAAGLDEFSALLVPTGRRAKEYEMIVNHLRQ
jgi:hypothetical protein